MFDALIKPLKALTRPARRALRGFRAGKAPRTAAGRCLFFVRSQKPLTLILGPLHRRHPRVIELDLTYDCNLRCKNCNRSCGQAPSEVRMTLGQIEHFVSESIEHDIRWDDIRLLGGEPTLHPGLFEIIDALLDYRRRMGGAGSITLLSNGAGAAVRSVLARIPEGITISSSSKDERPGSYAWYVGEKGEEFYIDFNDAPKDHARNTLTDYANGCWIPVRHGIGLNPYGYYCCSCAASIDRVFGFDLGRKSLPHPEDLMAEQRRVFCGLCGHFGGGRKVVNAKGATISPSWEKAYARYNAGGQPELTRYGE